MNFSVERKRQHELWRKVIEARSEKGLLDFPAIVRHLREIGGEPTIPELMYIQGRLSVRDRPSGLSHSVPLSVAQFCFSFLQNRPGTRILDPYGGYGLLGGGLAANLENWKVDTITPLSDARNIIEPFGLPNMTVNRGTIQDVKGNLIGKYDAIVSILPVGGGRECRFYSCEGSEIGLCDDQSLLSIVELEPLLSDNGTFALVVPPRFGLNNRTDSVRQNLDKFGLHLSSLLQFRPGTFPGAGIGFELAIIDRIPRNNLFVASIPEDIELQVELVAKMRKRKQGKTAGQGRLVSPDLYHGLAALEGQERYAKLVRGKGLDPVPFSIAVPEIFSLMFGRRNSGNEQYEDHPHAVYLPVMQNKNATTRQGDLPDNMRSFMQLLVDPNVVLPEYLAGWFNTSMGQSLRQICTKSSMNSLINPPLLKGSTLYLPSIDEQRQVMQAYGDIRRLRSELSEIESQLWDKPREASKLREELDHLNNEERFLDWVETLPFPLASILRLYQTSDRTDKEKYERLLHFFEAFTQFNATIHISAFKSNEMLWEQKRERIIQNIRKQHLSVERASFGLWRAIGEQLSASLREMLAEDDQKSEACELYATSDIFPLEMLSSSEIVGLLQRVNNFRNRWTGHGGAVTDGEAAERLRLLGGELAKFREIFGTSLLQYQLIEPHEGRTLEGPTFLYHIRRVMGSNPQLEQDEIELISPAISNNLYLYNTGHNKALKLVPLIQVHDSLQPTSYFYNRLERSGPYLISYHLASESEITDNNTALLSIIDDLAVKQEDMLDDNF